MVDKQKNHEQSNNYQHKIFKAVILVIVAIFFCLILYFFYIQFVNSGSNIDPFFQKFAEKYNYIYNKVNKIKLNLTNL